MIEFSRFKLPNGLTVLHNFDETTPMVAVNTLYKVGAKHEKPDRTGFAHLFEHLMFGGSKNIPCFDTPIQFIGGESNAFTNNDITNYYITLPANNIETAFWLESDRMLELDFSQKSLDVQKSVVIEEFNQRYLNQPYGDVWLLLRPLIYKKHPYRWPTIGISPKHIEEASLEEVKSFFYSHYNPENAVLAISGNLSYKKTVQLVEKWYGDIPYRKTEQKKLPIEPPQTEKIKLEVERDVPSSMIYKIYRMCDKLSDDYPVFDLISDILSNGKSSRLTQHWIKEKTMFSDVNAYITGDNDAGLLVLQGSLNKGVSMEEAEAAFDSEINELKNTLVTDYELEKVKNRFESMWIFSEMSILSKATNLASMELLGDADLINHEIQRYRKIDSQRIKDVVNKFLTENNSTVLYYRSIQK